MGAQLNIKSEEAYSLASELAARDGVSITQAVLNALRAQRRRLDHETRFEAAMKICRETAAMMSPETLAFDIDKELYDENGLPK